MLVTLPKRAGSAISQYKHRTRTVHQLAVNHEAGLRVLPDKRRVGRENVPTTRRDDPIITRRPPTCQRSPDRRAHDRNRRRKTGSEPRHTSPKRSTAAHDEPARIDSCQTRPHPAEPRPDLSATLRGRFRLRHQRAPADDRETAFDRRQPWHADLFAPRQNSGFPGAAAPDARHTIRPKPATAVSSTGATRRRCDGSR